MVPTGHFWAKKCHKLNFLQSNLFFPGSIRINFSRSVILDAFQRDLQEGIRFFAKKVTKKLTKIAKNTKISIKRSSVGHFGLVPN